MKIEFNAVRLKWLMVFALGFVFACGQDRNPKDDDLDLLLEAMTKTVLSKSPRARAVTNSNYYTVKAIDSRKNLVGPPTGNKGLLNATKLAVKNLRATYGDSSLCVLGASNKGCAFEILTQGSLYCSSLGNNNKYEVREGGCQ